MVILTGALIGLVAGLSLLAFLMVSLGALRVRGVSKYYVVIAAMFFGTWLASAVTAQMTTHINSSATADMK